MKHGPAALTAKVECTMEMLSRPPPDYGDAAVLESPRVAHEIRFARVQQDTNIAFASTGSGVPLVHVPLGPFFTLDMALQLIAADATRALPRYRQLFYDHRGLGLSNGERDFSLESQVADLAAVVDALEDRPVCLFAALNAAPAAITYCVRFPERVLGLGLWAPYVRGSDFQEQQSIVARVELAKVDWPMFIDTIASQMYGWASAEKAATFSRLLARTITPEALGPAFEAQAEADVSSLLSQVRARTVVFHPAGLRRPPVQLLAEVSQAIRGAALVLPEGAGVAPFSSGVEAVRRSLEGRHLVEDDAAAPPATLAELDDRDPTSGTAATALAPPRGVVAAGPAPPGSTGDGASPASTPATAISASGDTLREVSEAIVDLGRGVAASHVHAERAHSPLFDPGTRELTAGGATVRLTPCEAQVFAALLQRRGQITTPEALSTLLWGEEAPDRHARAGVRTHIYTLRCKLRSLALGGAIESVRGGGYRLTLPSVREA